MTIRDAARKILSESRLPLSARQIWAEVVRRGLDRQVATKGRTPDATMGAWLYVQAKNPGSGIIATGRKPTMFRICGHGDGAVSQSHAHSESRAEAPGIRHERFNSKFYFPCLEVLASHAPSPMGVQQILSEALSRTPSLNWGRANGAVRAALLRASSRKTPIRQVPDSVPPRFYVESPDVAAATARDANVASPTTAHAPETYSFLECAEKVLRDFGARKPMHYQDITQKAIELGWLKSDGESPANTMNAIIGTDIKKRLSSRRPPLFAKHGKGYIGLAEWIDPIQPEIDKHNKAVMTTLLSRIREMDAKDFERLIARLLDEMDFLDTEVTRYSGDGGIDVRGTWRIADGIRIKMAIQVKRWKANVQAPAVQAIRGALTGSERGMIITTSDFSKGAKEEAEDQRKASTISLVNGEQLVKLLVEKGIGVTRKRVEILGINTESLLSAQSA